MTRHGLTLLMASLAGAAACSSFDDDVFPHVVSASLRADPAEPDAIADVQVTLRIVAGPTADRSVALGPVELWTLAQPPARAATLALAFPDGDTLAFHDGEARTVKLANIGTKNGDLAPLCGETYTMTVRLAYPEDPAGSNGTGTGGGAPQVSIVCD